MSMQSRSLTSTVPHAGLSRAAKVVEDIAFDIAAERPKEVVAQLILIAADLERLARKVGPEVARSH